MQSSKSGALHKSFGTLEVLKGIDLAVAQGELVFIIGPSGSGKSTLLRCCNRLEEPTSGSVLVDGTDITRAGVDINRVRQKIGMVFQSFNLYPHLNALGNVTLALRKVVGKTRDEAEALGMRGADPRGARRKSEGATRTSSRAASSSASPSRARSRSSRASCCSTSRPARSTRNSSAACSR